jgi:hypothetical protein
MLSLLRKTLLQPRRAFRAAMVEAVGVVAGRARFAALRPPKTVGRVPYERAVHESIRHELVERGFEVQCLTLDLDDYRRYRAAARYDRFPTYYGGGRSRGIAEKALEHYLAMRLLELAADDVCIDVASQGSPAPTIYHDLTGCTVYRQDLTYRSGVHGQRIGGDAGAMPVPDGFATKLTLHNAFEHFEGDSDIRFIEEAGRVLRPGGRLCILPLFLHDRYAIQTDPAALPRQGLPFEDDAVLYCARGWRDRHGRFYDVPHLISRIRDHLGPLRMKVVVIENELAVDPDVYLRFAALFERARHAG